MRFKLLFLVWYDFWVGGYYDREGRKLYIFLIPCLLGMVFDFGYLRWKQGMAPGTICCIPDNRITPGYDNIVGRTAYWAKDSDRACLFGAVGPECPRGRVLDVQKRGLKYVIVVELY